MEEETSFGLDPVQAETQVELRPNVQYENRINEEAEAVKAQQIEEEVAVPTAVEEDPKPTAQPAGEQPAVAQDQGGLQPVNTSPYAKEDGTLDIEKVRRDGSAFDSFAIDGLADFGVDLLNVIPGVDIQKKSDYENETAQAMRDIAAVVIPSVAGGAAFKAAGAAAHARVGWNVGNTPFISQLGRTGADALASLSVGAVSAEYEDHNLLGTLKKNFPATYDFVPDSLATVDSDSPDQKRAKNIKEDIYGGVLLDLLEPATVLAKGLFRNRQVAVAPNIQRAVPKLVGETPQASAWVDANQPKIYDTPEEAVIANAIKREESLDELGAYNLSLNPKMDVPLKGVHDMFDEAELGMRQVDNFGVVDAGIDAARIKKNLDTVEGRLSNFISEPALKYALSDADAMGDVSLGLARQLQEAGEVGMVGKGWKVTYADQIDATMDIAVDLFDPRMSKADLDRVIEPMRVLDENTGKTILTEEGYGMITKALKGFGEDITSMNYARAQALTAGSTAGRISDIAQGIRLTNGSVTVESAQETVVDLMKHLYKLQGEADFYKSRKVNLLTQVKNGFTDFKSYNDATISEGSDLVKKLYRNAEHFGDSITQLSKTNPRLMQDFLYAYEMTDGNVFTINLLNKYVNNLVGAGRKSIVDLDPDTQSLFMAGLWNNIYNNALSAIRTPIAALTGGFGGTISKPVAHFTGALAYGDFKRMQRYWIAYSSVQSSLSNAFEYAGSIFRKASQDPSSVASVTRVDLLLKQEKELDFLKGIAASKAAEGDEGLNYMVQSVSQMHSMAKDPILRAGSNGLIATDGLTGSMIADAEARFRIMDRLADEGKKVTKETVEPLVRVEYDKMFNKNGILKDEAVKWTNNELALNLDTPLAKVAVGAGNVFPILKPFLMFPTTSSNKISMLAKYNPFGKYVGDINMLADTPVSQIIGNRQFIDDFLSQRGVDVANMSDLAKQNKVIDIKYEAKGRQAIGMAAVGGAMGLLMNTRATGSRGLMNDKAQMSRVKNSNWEPKTITLPTGQRVSYAGLGVLGDWMGLTIDIADNYNNLGSVQTGELLNLMGNLMGASLYDGTALSTIKPLIDMTSGKDPTRWIAGFLNSVGPLAGQRAEWSRVFAKGLRVVENEYYSQLQNRNRFLDEFDPSADNAYIYNPVTGKMKNDYGFLQRLWNSTMEYKIFDGQTDEEVFLTESNFDVVAGFEQLDGVVVPAKIRSELMKIVGEQQIFNKAIKKEMKWAEKNKVVEKLKEMRVEGVEINHDLILDINNRLTTSLNTAKDFAVQSLPPSMKQELLVLQAQQRENERAARFGEEPQNLSELYRK